VSTDDRDETMLCLLAVRKGRVVPGDDGGLVAVFDGLPPLPIKRRAFDWLERAGLMVITGDDRCEATARGRWQVDRWSQMRAPAYLAGLERRLAAQGAE